MTEKKPNMFTVIENTKSLIYIIFQFSRVGFKTT